MRHIWILIFSTFIIGCKNTDNKIIISGFISDTSVKTVNLKTDDSTLIDSLDNGIFRFELNDMNDSYIDLKIRDNISLFVNRGDSIYVEIDCNNKLTISGKGSEESNYLLEKKVLAKRLGISNPRQLDISLYSSSTFNFIERIDSVMYSRYKFLDTYKGKYPKISKVFVRMERELIKCFWMNQRFKYYEFHKMLTKLDASLPKDYYKFIEEINPNQTELYRFKEYRNVLNALIDYKSKELGKIESIDLLNEKFTLAKKLFSDKKIFDDIISRAVITHINFNGIDGIDSIYNEVLPFVTDKANKSRLVKKYTAWKNLTKGNKAPNFELEDVNGEMVRLSDFKGKYLYIDCWSSYCGPCLSQLPAMKLLADEFADKDIVFISVSMDRNRDRWLNKLKEFDLNIVNLCTGGKKHQFNKDYIIRALPRYILIDKEGVIIDAAAPKPSMMHEQLKELASKKN